MLFCAEPADTDFTRCIECGKTVPPKVAKLAKKLLHRGQCSTACTDARLARLNAEPYED